MASDNRPWYHDLAIAICTIALVLITTSFLRTRSRLKKRRHIVDSDVANVIDLQQQQQEIDGNSNLPSSSSSRDTDTGGEYEVFLSSIGTDIQKKFTDGLYHGLIDAGVSTLISDSEELHVGEEISPKFLKSIKQVKIGIPIFSAEYMSSKRCLMEVAEMVKYMKQSQQKIMPLYFDVTPDVVQHQTGSYAGSFFRHEKTLDPEKVQGWREALKEVVKLKGLELPNMATRDQDEFIKLIIAMVVRGLKKPCLEEVRVLIGIEDRAAEIMNRLEVGLSDVRVVGIWGTGGIGKTTIAEFVYNQIVDNFESSCFLKDIRILSRNPKGLQELQSKLVSEVFGHKPEEYTNVDEGITAIKERFPFRKSLIVLDGVDHVDQIRALAADVDFKRGSRMIITTRQKRVLDDFQVQDPYEVPLLDNDQALELFCQHVFGDKSPRPDYINEAHEITNITGGLPLALEVIGSFLSVYVGRKNIWNSTVEKLKMKPDIDVQDKLSMSYQSLSREEKEIFLDIACFYAGMDFRLVFPMWTDANLFPEVGIENLQRKSLIKIGEDNKIWMHDQLIDFGRSIVHQEDVEPGQWSRLWNCADSMAVLAKRQGTSKLEAVSIEGHDFTKEADHLKDEMFMKLTRLRVLELGSASLKGNFKHLLDQLRWLSWHKENISPPENLVLMNLIVLDLSRSLIDESWIGRSSIKVGSKLKVLNLSKCRISRTPEFSSFPLLEGLILESCEQLISLDPSIGLLKNLILLNLRNCQALKKLPKQLSSIESLVEFLIDDTGVEELPILSGMKKLEILSANNCRDLIELPESIGSLVSLKKLSLRNCSGLYELLDSIGHLTSLVDLCLSHTKIKRLPDFVGELLYLESLKIDYTYIRCLPGKLYGLKKLKLLDANWLTLDGEREIQEEVLSLSSLRILRFRGIKTLPASLSALSCLQTLHLSECGNLQNLPELPSSLDKLTVEASSKLTSMNLANLAHLRELSFSGDFNLKEEWLSGLESLMVLKLHLMKVSIIPEEIGAFLHLKELYFRECQELKSLPKLPGCLTVLSISKCYSLEMLPDLSNLNKLTRLELPRCSKLREIEGLGDLASLRLMWTDGSPLTKLDGLERLESLGCLSAANSEFESLPDLSRMKNLHTLVVGGNKNLVEIPGLNNLNCFKTLVMDNCKSLKRLPNVPRSLVRLYLGGCEQLTNIDAVNEAESLEGMDVSDCRSLMDFPDLSKLPRLKIVTKERIKVVRVAREHYNWWRRGQIILFSAERISNF